MSPPRQIMTAAKSKTKRPEEQQTIEHKEKPKEKVTSSKPEKTKSEETKKILKEEKPPMSKSIEPCTGECKEICKAGPKWEECKLTCKVPTEHVSKIVDARCI